MHFQEKMNVFLKTSFAFRRNLDAKSYFTYAIFPDSGKTHAHASTHAIDASTNACVDACVDAWLSMRRSGLRFLNLDHADSVGSLCSQTTY